jgi:hypothetical protein
MAIDNPAFKKHKRGYLEMERIYECFWSGCKLDIDLPSERQRKYSDTSRYNRDFGGTRWNSCNILTLGHRSG